jgi:fructokinase
MKILSIGEILWDVFEGVECLGGAPFNFAVHARRLGHSVRFVSAVGEDERGDRALAALEQHRFGRGFVERIPGAPTGVARVVLDAEGHPAFTIERPAAYDLAELSDAALAALSAWAPGWLYFGTLHQLYPQARALTRRALAACAGARRFYDVNLRRDSYTPELVADLLGDADVLKLNRDELPVLAWIAGAPAHPIENFCRFCAGRYGCLAVCVTLGGKGSAVLIREEYVETPAYRVEIRDTVGVGDAFAAAFLHGLGNGWPAARIADFANRVGALVASRPGAIPQWTFKEAQGLR